MLRDSTPCALASVFSLSINRVPTPCDRKSERMTIGSISASPSCINKPAIPKTVEFSSAIHGPRRFVCQGNVRNKYQDHHRQWIDLNKYRDGVESIASIITYIFRGHYPDIPE